MSNELRAAEHFLYAKMLAGGVITAGATGIYSGAAPRDAPPPFVIFAFQGAPGDVVEIGHYRLAIEPLYLVRAIGHTGRFSDVQPIADAIDNALHGASGTADGYQVAQCVREDVYSLVETTGEAPWNYLGGYYRLYIVANP